MVYFGGDGSVSRLHSDHADMVFFARQPAPAVPVLITPKGRRNTNATKPVNCPLATNNHKEVL